MGEGRGSACQRAAMRAGGVIPALTPAAATVSLQILLIAFLKVIDEGSHMVMMECPETVNTLLHEFVLWEPETPAGDGQGEKK